MMVFRVTALGALHTDTELGKYLANLEFRGIYHIKAPSYLRSCVNGQC